MSGKSKYNELTLKIRYSFLFLEALFLATGCILVVTSVMWLMNFGVNIRSAVVSKTCITGGLAIGIFIIFTSFIGFPGFISPLRCKGWLKLHAFMIIISALGLLALGGRIWFSTLEERHHFSDMWHDEYSNSMKIAFQDELQCCGFSNVTDNALPSNYCTASRLADNSTMPCIALVCSAADNLLRRLFTTLFGFMVVDTFIFFSTIILIQTITVEQRYRKIDSKYGSVTDKVLDRQYL